VTVYIRRHEIYQTPGGFGEWRVWNFGVGGSGGEYGGDFVHAAEDGFTGAADGVHRFLDDGVRGDGVGRNFMANALQEKIVIQQGDLTEMDTDAIVNAANNDLILGGGVAGAIRRKGGEEIQRECDAIGSIPVGYAAITGGGKLKARFVIHAASMQMGGATTAEALRSSTAYALRIAWERQLKTVAFPAVGTGIAGFPMKECAAIMLTEAARHLQAVTSIEKIYFVLFDDEACDVFERAWKRLQTEIEKGSAEISGAASPTIH
jgi:O-acetyl-ADP-ribose deacetylase (regulator of RNase III)